MRNNAFVFAVITISFIAACSNAQVATTDSQAPIAQSTPSNKFTAADVAKLKWIEGTWRGMDGDENAQKARLRKVVSRTIGTLYYNLPPSEDSRSVLYKVCVDPMTWSG
jgi:hypothetical protein